MPIELLQEHFRQVSDAGLVIGIADIYNPALAHAILGLDYSVKTLNAVRDIGETAFLSAAVDKQNRRTFDKIENQLCNGARAAYPRGSQAVKFWPYPVERPKQSEPEPFFLPVGPDDPVEQLLTAGIYSTLHPDRPENQPGLVFVKFFLITHAVHF